MAHSNDEIRGVLIQAGEYRLLLPNATVAEVLTRAPVEPVADMPDWLPGRIDWHGWRYVTFPLQPSDDSRLAHWEGANDGQVHPPTTWESCFLLDNVSRQPLEGALYLAAPTLFQ